METNLSLVEQFLTEANMSATDFYSITISPYRITFYGNFDRELGMKASNFGEGRLSKCNGYIHFNFNYSNTNTNIDITLT